MSPKKKPAAGSQYRLHISLSVLAPLLDLPPGVTVTGAYVRDDIDARAEVGIGLYLDGDDPSLAASDDGHGLVDADYSVDAAGRRTFNTFKPTSESTNPDRTEEKE